MHCPPIAQLQAVLGQYRCQQQVVRLTGIRIESHHMESQPRRHCSRVIVARQSIRPVAVRLVDDLVHPAGTQVGAPYPMIQTRSEERRFVLHIVMTLVEESVEPLTKGLCPAATLYQTLYIMRHTQRILCRQGLVEECRPPWQIPGCHFRNGGIGNLRMEHLRAAPRHTVHPLTTGRARHDETTHAPPFVVVAPQVFPVLRAFHILFTDIPTSQLACHLRNTPVVVSILHGARSRTVDAVRHISQPYIFVQSSATVFLMVGTRVHLAILQHGLQCQLIVDALNTLGQCVGYHNVGIRAALRATVAVATTCIGQVALALVDIQQRVHDVGLPLFVE